jgi:hypothetical protein
MAEAAEAAAAAAACLVRFKSDDFNMQIPTYQEVL